MVPPPAMCCGGDEASQVDIGLLTQLAKLCWAGVHFLLSGDFTQFAPICNKWRGSPVPDDVLERSALLHTMAGGSRCTLTECRRGDRKLFDFTAPASPAGCEQSSRSRFVLPRRRLCSDRAPRLAGTWSYHTGGGV
jgi:hypothetical protein